jgi:3-phosphoshikimate 1-carboxyvinyltransferase
MRTIQPKPLKPAVTVRVPGSKSYTHRTFIAAALSNGVCRISNALRSEDTLLTLDALRKMGIRIQDQQELIIIEGGAGHLGAYEQPIYLGNSGTSMRLLGGVVILGQGNYILTGSQRMCERPIGALLEGLQQLGIHAVCEHGNNCPPVVIGAGQCPGGRTSIDCSVSSQYLSGLLLSAPCLDQGMTIDVVRGPVSKPYIDMTVDILKSFGIRLTRDGYTHFQVPGRQIYQAGDYAVEPDGSQAGYFWAAAAVTGASIKVQGVTAASRQGDVGLAEIFGRMGCTVTHEVDGIRVGGGPLKAVEVDMGNMPDMVPTLSVVAAFARGTTVIRNVAHLRSKESDRLAAVSRELSKMGIDTTVGPDELRIVGGTARGAAIETYNDHRIAMSFAVAGLRAPGTAIANPSCVGKSFPDFWEVFEGLYR